MSSENSPQLHYPYNLLTAIKGGTNLSFPVTLSADIYSGLNYALSTLTEPECELIHLHFCKGLPLSESAAALNVSPDHAAPMLTKALKKLRRPSRWNYIQYGIAGYLEKETASQYNRGFLAGYAAGYHTCMEDNRNGRTLPPLEDEILNLPIEALTLSARAYHVLHRKEDTRIRDVVALNADEILRLRNLGAKTANEIARALQAAGVPIAHTAWHQYLL